MLSLFHSAWSSNKKKKYVVFEFLLCYFRRSYPKQFYILCLYYRHFFMSFLGFLAANKEKSTDFFSVFVFDCEYMWNKKMNMQRRKKHHVGIQKKSRRSFGCSQLTYWCHSHRCPCCNAMYTQQYAFSVYPTSLPRYPSSSKQMPFNWMPFTQSEAKWREDDCRYNKCIFSIDSGKFWG